MKDITLPLLTRVKSVKESQRAKEFGVVRRVVYSVQNNITIVAIIIKC